MSDDVAVDAMLRILDCTKSNKQWFDEKAFVAGYQSVTIHGQTFKGQRDTSSRLAKVPYDFHDKVLLDVGCSTGALLHHLAPLLRFGVGLDFNPKCINAANALKAVNHVTNVHFYAFDLDKDDLALLQTFLLNLRVDLCLFLNLSLWVKRWKQVLASCSELTTTLLFEAHGNVDEQRDQMAFVRTLFTDITPLSATSEDDPTYSKRSLYLCGNPVRNGHSFAPTPPHEFLFSTTEEAIRLVYERAFPAEKVEQVVVLAHAHESIVAEINQRQIVKFPRPGRGVDGILAEQLITGFLRQRVAIQIPDLVVRTDHVVLARYPKLPGFCFDKSKYAALSESDRELLAAEIAAFQFAVHSVALPDLAAIPFEARPSWNISCELIIQQLGSDSHRAIRAMLEKEVAIHNDLEVPDTNRVFGHFDLHGSNILLDERNCHLLSVIDFGNCKVGDIHQDMSSMNLSSPDLADRIMRHYEQLSGRTLDRSLVRHYTSIFYLHLLASLKRSQDSAKYQHWLSQFSQWYEHVIHQQALDQLRSSGSVSSIPYGWRKWFASNLMKGSAKEGLRGILAKQGFDDVDVEYDALLFEEHPFAEAGKEIAETLLKRNWLLKTYDALSALDPRYSVQVERRPVPPFDVFVREYYSKLLPVVLTGGVDLWPASKNWTPEYFSSQHGDAEIEIQANGIGSVRILGDDRDEANENFTITLSNPTYATIHSTQNTATVTILDDDNLKSPGNQTHKEGSTVALPIEGNSSAYSTNGGVFTATGLPPGLSISPGNGEISGKISFQAVQTQGGVYPVTVQLKSGATVLSSVTFTWTVTDATVGHLTARELHNGAQTSNSVTVSGTSFTPIYLSPGNNVRLIVGVPADLPPNLADVLYYVSSSVAGNFSTTPTVSPI